MMPNQGSHLEVLDYDHCTRLLASAVVGRLAWVGPAGPLVVPVNFLWTGTAVRIRTDPGARVTELIGHPVAFEIDDLDPHRRIGWSVVVTGTATLVDGDGGTFPSWAPGSKSLCVEVVPLNISGRRLVAETSPSPSTVEDAPEQRQPADLNPFWRMSAYS